MLARIKILIVTIVLIYQKFDEIKGVKNLLIYFHIQDRKIQSLVLVLKRSLIDKQAKSFPL